IVRDVAPLLCHIIAYMPENHRVTIRTLGLSEPKRDKFILTVGNTGIDLSHVTEIPLACRQPMNVLRAADNGTTFELTWSFAREDAATSPTIAGAAGRAEQSAAFLPAFYAEVRKRFQSHYTKSENLVAALSLRQPKEASFLREVNAMIEANLHTEGFDVASLSASMNMSRVQLYRRLKPLIRQAPAEYIKLIRLQKAKQLLETTELRMGEIAYKTGFQSQSHFTKVFTRQYGMPPSLFSRSNRKDFGRK
ncbi:MAG TPA: AraC family transcriptional regulator, partial [Puia sp.]|nr:AraC family transcriptional regulator [Puia sp.]